MRVAWSAILLFLAQIAWAQAVISGVVADPGGPLEGVPVRARNVETGQAFEALTSATGAYTLEVPAATYDLFATRVSYQRFIRRNVALGEGQKVKLDVTLAYGPNFGIPGENPFGLLRLEQEPPSGPAPRTAWGAPDLSGVWFPSLEIDPEEPPARPWAAELQRARAADFGKDDPRAHCLPSGVPRTHHFDLAKIVQTPDLLVLLIEGAPPGFRQVFLDGREHPAEPAPSWTGHSTGRWDGDTLVIDTVGFHDRGWIDNAGHPQTEQLHVIERYHRPGLGRLSVEITIDDPGAYERPWKIRRELALAQGFEVQEYVCNENEKPEHLVGRPPTGPR
jgi:hypothetical protein